MQRAEHPNSGISICVQGLDLLLGGNQELLGEEFRSHFGHLMKSGPKEVGLKIRTWLSLQGSVYEEW